MNCKEAHLLIADLNGETLPAGLAAHLETCRDCADLLAVDARLRATLRSHAPVASPVVRGRIRQEIAAPEKPLSFPRERRVRRGMRSGAPQGDGGEGIRESLRKNPIMKITLSALTALAIATALVSLPHAADAATPLATFAKMKKAVLAHAKSLTPLEVHVGKTDDGSVGTWVVLDGELTQLGPNGTFHSNKDGKDITVTSSIDGGDLSSLTPAQRAEVRKAIQDAMNGQGNGSNVSTTYIVNGKKVDAATADTALRQSGLDFSLSIDLDENDYRSIAFGTDHDHLVLLSKKAKDRRSVIALDPRTSLPKSVLLERNVKGKWIAAKRSNVRLR